MLRLNCARIFEFLVSKILISEIFLTISNLFSIATFVSSKTGQNLCYINGKLYKKIKGRMFRSFYTCVESNCDAELVVVDLKGGFLKITRDHRPFCKNKGSLPTSATSKIKCLQKDQ